MKDGFTHVAKLDLSGQTLKVLLYLIGISSLDNRIWITQTEIGEALGMRPSHVSRSIKELQKHRILHKESKKGTVWIYRIDDDLGSNIV